MAVSIEGRRFVAMRFKRIKTWSHVYHVRRHNTREMECNHLEKDAPPPRLIVGDADVAGAIRRVLDRYGAQHKPGEVMALEFVVSTSREIFEGLDEKTYAGRVGEFGVATLRAFLDRFKIEGQIVSAALHEDERTPHLHVVIVPLVCEVDNRRKDKTPFYRLSAKRVVGGRGDMSREQTRFASYFEGMGLERGKERSGARHVSNREHEAMLEQARAAALAERNALAAERRIVVGAAIDLGRQRDALETTRVEIERQRLANETERARLRDEAVRLAEDRQAVMNTAEEAEALKDRAIRRAKVLRGLLDAAEDLRKSVLAIPAERRSSATQRVHASSTQLEARRQAAMKDDEWLATVLAYRNGVAGIGLALAA